MPGASRRLCLAGVSLAAWLMPGCAPTRLTLPTGAGTAFPDSDAAYSEATTDCRGVTAMSASLALSGRAGKTKLRGRIDAGVAAPSQLRLEFFAPIGFGSRPYFILVARGNDTTLVLPRAARVLRGAKPAAIVEALAGVALGPDELRSVLSGCGLGVGTPANGRRYPNGWGAVDLAQTTVFLRQLNGRWRIAAAARPPLTIEYAEGPSGGSGAASLDGLAVRLRSAPASDAAAVDVSLRLSQVDVNVPLDARAFDVEVPGDFTAITLEELRRLGPLGGGSTER
jgi:hypothetical protein